MLFMGSSKHLKKKQIFIIHDHYEYFRYGNFLIAKNLSYSFQWFKVCYMVVTFKLKKLRKWVSISAVD